MNPINAALAAAMQPVTEEIVQRAAHKFGPGSAGALALADAKERRAKGEPVAFYFLPGSGFIVADPATVDPVGAHERKA